MKDQKFEEVMEELEKIVQELENGDLDLETSIKQFEKGMELSKKCNDVLENAEKKIVMLTKNEANEFKEKNFEN